jgi:hypothetical protein
MAETTNKKQGNPDAEGVSKSAKAAKPAKPAKAAKPPKSGDADQAPQLTNLLEGFTSDEMVALVRTKEAVEQGLYTDITNEHRKLLFVKWLVEHDKLAS